MHLSCSQSATLNIHSSDIRSLLLWVISLHLLALPQKRLFGWIGNLRCHRWKRVNQLHQNPCLGSLTAAKMSVKNESERSDKTMTSLCKIALRVQNWVGKWEWGGEGCGEAGRVCVWVCVVVEGQGDREKEKGCRNIRFSPLLYGSQRDKLEAPNLKAIS